jgi:hypothetical protein
MDKQVDACVLISAGAEWRGFLPHFPDVKVRPTPYGESFQTTFHGWDIVRMHGGWGKIAAAGSTQYAIDRWLQNASSTWAPVAASVAKWSATRSS